MAVAFNNVLKIGLELLGKMDGELVSICVLVGGIYMFWAGHVKQIVENHLVCDFFFFSVI